MPCYLLVSSYAFTYIYCVHNCYVILENISYIDATQKRNLRLALRFPPTIIERENNSAVLKLAEQRPTPPN